MKTPGSKNILGLSLALMVFLPLLSAQGSAAALAMNPGRHPRPAAMPFGSGTPFDDEQVALGTAGPDRIVQYGRGGNDTQYAAGLDGSDWIAQYGGTGNDKQTGKGGSRDDYVYQDGGDGNDTITCEGNLGNDWVVQEGGAGDDTMEAQAGDGNDDLIQRGGAGNDALKAFGGLDDDVIKVYGGEGDDTITLDLSAGADVVLLDGGAGNDTLTINILNQNLTVLDEQGNRLCQFGTGGTTVTIKDIEQFTVMGAHNVPLPCPAGRSGNGDAGVTGAPRIAQCAALPPDLTGPQEARAPTSMVAGGGPGSSVAISGDVVVVGAPDRDAAYVFVKAGSGWGNMGYTAQLTASDNVAGDGFGAAVAISGDTIVVGAPFAEVGGKDVQGAAYVFVKPPTGWAGNLTQTAVLTASDGAAGDQFGASVAVSGATVAVGAPFAAMPSSYARGAAYVFVKPGSGWTNMAQTAKLAASDGAAADAFGASVAISSDVVLVGAPWHDIGANTDQGAAYVFVKPGGGWATMTQNAVLTASDGATDKFGAELGSAVSISGDAAVVGAWLADVGAHRNQGAAYLFAKPGGGWGNMTQTGRLTASETDADEFGISVAIDGDTVVVGSPIANRGKGAGYVFVKPGGGWANMTQNARLTSSDAGADGFGASAAISGSTIAVGAPTGNSGVGYMFVRPSGGWAGNLTQTARLYLPSRLFLPIVLR